MFGHYLLLVLALGLLLVFTHTVIICLFLVLLARAVFAVSSYYFIYCTLVVYS